MNVVMTVKMVRKIIGASKAKKPCTNHREG